MTSSIALVWVLLLASEALAPTLGPVFASQWQALVLVGAVLVGAYAVLSRTRDARAVTWRRGSPVGPMLMLVALVAASTVYRVAGSTGHLAYLQLWDAGIWLLGLGLWGATCATLAADARAHLLTALAAVVSLCAGAYLLAGVALKSPAVSTLATENAWPLINPNHSGVLFASALVLVLGSLSHRFVVLRQRQARSPMWRTLAQPMVLWEVVQMSLLTLAIVHAGSFSALLVALGGTVLLILSDHYMQLDWVMRRAMDALRGRQRWIMAGGLLLPMALVILTGSTGLYRGSAVRITLWADSLRGFFHEPMGWLWGMGPATVADHLARMRSGHMGYPTQVLGPESELVYGLLVVGLGGLLAFGVFLLRMPWMSLFSQRMGVLSHDWHARLALWALVVVLAQAMVDNTLHTSPMQYWVVMLASLSLRTIKAYPQS